MAGERAKVVEVASVRARAGEKKPELGNLSSSSAVDLFQTQVSLTEFMQAANKIDHSE